MKKVKKIGHEGPMNLPRSASYYGYSDPMGRFLAKRDNSANWSEEKREKVRAKLIEQYSAIATKLGGSIDMQEDKIYFTWPGGKAMVKRLED